MSLALLALLQISVFNAAVKRACDYLDIDPCPRVVITTENQKTDTGDEVYAWINYPTNTIHVWSELLSWRMYPEIQSLTAAHEVCHAYMQPLRGYPHPRLRYLKHDLVRYCAVAISQREWERLRRNMYTDEFIRKNTNIQTWRERCR